ncbi:MAG: S1C family serine protease [bacterium]|nr:S1C family serine protease [bacterium]
MKRTSLLLITSVVVIQLSLTGCSQRDGVLQQLDREFQRLSGALSPAIVLLLPVGDDGETTGISGSALAIGINGELLTTASAIKDGKPLVAQFSDGRRSPVTLIGSDWETNLALLRLDSARADLSIPLIGAHDVATGQLGILVGSAPMISGAVVMYGMLSKTTLGGDDPYDAPLYALSAPSMLARPGAPVFDVSGRLLGIVDGKMHAISSGSWTVVPLRTIKAVLPLLERGGGVPRGVLGVVPNPSGETAEGGVIVKEVVPESPAEKAGIKSEDIIIECDQMRTLRISSLRVTVAGKPGQTVGVSYLRGGKRVDVNIPLGSHVGTPNDPQRDPFRKL